MTTAAPKGLQENVLLAPYTTLKLGGPAQFFLEARDEQQLLQALEWADAQKLALTLLSGGSNVVIADAGISGLVVRVSLVGSHVGADGAVTAMAGENWDA